MKKDKRRRKIFIFSSFLLCAVALSLYASALATQAWFVAGCSQKGNDLASGNIQVGLWDGKLEKTSFSTATDILKIVCVDGECMWSCGKTKEDREAQLSSVKSDNGTFDVFTDCNIITQRHIVKDAFNPLYAAEGILHSVGIKTLADLQVAADESTSASISSISTADKDTSASISSISTTDTKEPVTDMVRDEPEFMDQGLWLATIVCLCFAMLWAIVGALFAVINTATTPVEWITGVGGLYVWNVLAVIFNVVCVSCWAAQFHLHLVSNVLLYDADANWTTEGQEKFGYSYWLVVVAIFIHIANIIIIYTGTYEPPIKQQLEAPDTKAGNIMLY